jgi:hypothetical protein
MGDLDILLNQPQIGTKRQNDLKLPFNISNQPEILGNTLDINPIYLLKVSALLMVTT